MNETDDNSAKGKGSKSGKENTAGDAALVNTGPGG